MPDEVGTEATRSDTSSADESLFGDPVVDRADPVVQAEDSTDAAPDKPDGGEETAQDEQGDGDAEGQAAGEEAQPAEDLKVVVSIKGGRATIGVQQTSSDPYIESFEDADLSGLTQEVSAVIERAKAKWEDEPKYPAHVRPDPPARRRNRREQGTAQAGMPEGETEQEQPETLRLF